MAPSVRSRKPLLLSPRTPALDEQLRRSVRRYDDVALHQRSTWTTRRLRLEPDACSLWSPPRVNEPLGGPTPISSVDSSGRAAMMFLKVVIVRYRGRVEVLPVAPLDRGHGSGSYAGNPATRVRYSYSCTRTSTSLYRLAPAYPYGIGVLG